MNNHYPIASQEELESWLGQYIPKLLRVGTEIGLELQTPELQPDHLGLQVMTAEEFDAGDAQLRRYAQLVLNEVIHDRRNRVYQFRRPLNVTPSFPRIEMYEPTPKYPLNIQTPGIQHAAFVVRDLPMYIAKLEKQDLIARDRTYSIGRFIKTKIRDTIEIELREMPLINTM